MAFMRIGRGVVLAALASTSLLVAGCATETTYRPATGQGFNRTGFSDRQVTEDRFLVSFAGNSVTSRDTVERYLLFRAAQLAIDHGYDYFVLAQRDTDLQSRTYSTGFGSGFGGGFGGYGRGFGTGFGGWGASWSYFGRGYGWRNYSPFYGGGFYGNDFDVRTIDRYEASAEVVLRRGPIPAGELRAFDARSVIQNVGPTVVLPEDRRR